MRVNPGIIILIGAGLFYIMKNKGGNNTAQPTQGMTAQQMRQAIIAYMNSGGDSEASKMQFAGIVAVMTETEVFAVYDYLINYVSKGRQVQPGSALYYSIQNISSKYGIFT